MDFKTLLSLGIEHWFAVLFITWCLLFLYWVAKRVFVVFDIWIENKKKKTPQQLDALNEEDNKIDREINNILFDILQKFQPDRVMVLQYHNWSYYNSGQHMKYVSCTHEQPNIWIAPWVMNFQRIPSAIFQPVNSSLMSGENTIILPHIWNDKEWENKREVYIRETYRHLWFKSYYAFALRTHEWHLIWKVTLVWLTKEIIYDEETIKKIQAQTYKIESLLNYNMMK